MAVTGLQSCWAVLQRSRHGTQTRVRDVMCCKGEYRPLGEPDPALGRVRRGRPLGEIHANRMEGTLTGRLSGFRVLPPIGAGCGFDPKSGHIQDSNDDCINKWNNK